MVSAAPVALVDDPSHHRHHYARKSCSIATSVQSELHVSKNGYPLAAIKKMVNSKHFGYVKTAFPGYKNVNSEARGPAHGEHVIVTGT